MAEIWNYLELKETGRAADGLSEEEGLRWREYFGRMDQVEGEFVRNPGLERHATGDQELAGGAMIGQMNGSGRVVVAGRVMQFVEWRRPFDRETMGMERPLRRKHDGEQVDAAHGTPESGGCHRSKHGVRSIRRP